MTIISPCGRYRYRLERAVPRRFMTDVDGIFSGKTVAFFGINPSTADAETDDATVRKWRGFCERWGAARFIVGNVFAYRAIDVRELAQAQNPLGPENISRLLEITDDADALIPCWGSRFKLPEVLWHRVNLLEDRLRVIASASGKPLLCFGRTKSGDPRHPLMLPYITKLEDFS